MNIYRSDNNIITKQQKQHYRVGTIDLSIAYFCLLLPPYYCFVLFLTNFLLLFLLYYYDAYVMFIDIISNNITIQKHQQHQRVGKTNISIVFFTFSFTFVLFFTLLSDNILFRCYIYLINIHK